MTSTASGAMTTAEQLLKDTLAACTAFQEWVGATTAATAAESIYLEALQPDEYYSDRHELERLKSRRPFAQIWTSEESGFSMQRTAAPNVMVANGTLYLRLERNVPEAIAHDYAEVDRTFKNVLGAIVSSGDAAEPGLAELGSQAGYLDIDTITVQQWSRTAPDEWPTIGDAQEATVVIGWGGRE